jgi:hypothetical protein
VNSRKKNLAVLVTSIHNLDSLKKSYKEASFLALDYSIIQTSGDEHIKPFLVDSISDYRFPNLSGEIASQWYRDKDGCDYLSGEFSMGLTIERRIGILTAIFIQYYSSLEHWIQQFDKIIIPSNIPILIKNIFLCFPDKVTFVNSSESYCKQVELLLDRAIVQDVSVHRLSPIVRKIQSVFSSRLKRKILCFSDWTYENQRNNQLLYMNSYNFMNGCYFENVKSVCDMPKSIDKKLATDSIIRVLVESKFNYSKRFLNGIVNLINYEYCRSIDSAIQIYYTYKKLLEDYLPTAIIVPGTVHPGYSMVMQISDKMKIPVLVVLDGFMVRIEKHEFYMSRKGNNPLVKNFASMGNTGYKLFKNYAPQSINIIKISPPIFDHFKDANPSSRTVYDVMILMPFPNLLNSNSRWDRRYKQVIDIARCLYSLGFCRIAVKVKQGKYEQDTIKIMNSIIKHEAINLSIVTGPSHKVIHSSLRIIGQLGTSIVEANYSMIPYYIYEPYENGITDNDIKKSIVNAQPIARNIIELESNLINNKCISLDKTDLCSGIDMVNIDFSSLSV